MQRFNRAVFEPIRSFQVNRTSLLLHLLLINFHQWPVHHVVTLEALMNNGGMWQVMEVDGDTTNLFCHDLFPYFFFLAVCSCFGKSLVLIYGTIYRLTTCYGTPTMFIDILNAQRRMHRNLSSLSTGIMAGAPCPPELVMSVINELNMKDFLVRIAITGII